MEKDTRKETAARDAEGTLKKCAKGAGVFMQATALTAVVVSLAVPEVAFAAEVTDILDKVLGLAVAVCQIIGGALVVYGGVKFGLAIKDQQGGSAMSEALATIGGGAIVFAAGSLFSTVTNGISLKV